MNYYEKIKANFTSYIQKVIINEAINYKKKVTYIANKEIHLSEELELTERIEHADILVEEIDYTRLEDIFTNEDYFYAMKKLSYREKLVLYLTTIKDDSLKGVADLLGTSENNISKIKYRAKNKFLNNLKKEK